MKKNLVKILSVLIVFCFVIFLNSSVFAIEKKDITNNFSGSAVTSGTTEYNVITNVIGNTLSAIRIVAIGIGIIMLTYLGIQYMSSAPNEKAEIKNKLIAFTVGVVLVVSASSILGIIFNLSKTIS